MSDHSEIEGEELCAFNIRTLPIDLRYAFRSLCSDLQIGMSNGLIKLMADAVDKQKIPGVVKNKPGLSMPKLTDSLERNHRK